VAPANPHSEAGHKVTTQTPIRLSKINESRYSLSGTPADCARIALTQIAPDADWLLSGINAGANLGSDIYHSGTVAAAREAAILGYPAMALSQYIARNCKVDWEVTCHHGLSVIAMLLKQNLEPGHFWNVNLPHPLAYESRPEVQFCSLDTNPHDFIYQRDGDQFKYLSDFHSRPRDHGKDVDVCLGGKISVTRIAIRTTKLIDSSS
jgi:5'-nucleotidase